MSNKNGNKLHCNNAALTKREYFAGLMMQAAYSKDYSPQPDVAARRAVKKADALLVELEKSK